jgi:phospholipase C
MFNHVVVLMFENASFDRMLGYLQTIGRDVDGVDLKHLRTNKNLKNAADPQGGPVGQAGTAAREVPNDPQHDLDNVLYQIADGGNNFVLDYVTKFPTASRSERAEIMAFYPRGFLPTLHRLAESFVVCDRWFCSVPGPTWPNRFFVHSGTSLGHVDMPEGIFDPGIHWYDQTTIYDVLEQSGTPWRIYYGDFAQSQLLVHQWQYQDHYARFDDFAEDVRTTAEADFPAYCFIEPSYFGESQNDQHPPHDVRRGDALLADVYNALKADPKLFNETLLVVLYDEHGGFYDHVAPSRAVPPDDNVEQFGFDQYGPRVPAVLISPRLPKAEQHNVLDHTSLLRFVIDNFKLHMANRNTLGRRVATATSMLEGIAIGAPRTDLPDLTAPQTEPPVAQAQLTTGQASLLSFSRFLETQISDPAERAPLRAMADTVHDGPAAQAKLATMRFAAFVDDRKQMAGDVAAPSGTAD